MKGVELKRNLRPSDLPLANSMDLCGLFSSCNQKDVAMLILLNCQKIGYWTPTYINDVYKMTLETMCKRNIIDFFGNGQYCLTNSTIKKIHDYIP